MPCWDHSQPGNSSIDGSIYLAGRICRMLRKTSAGLDRREAYHTAAWCDLSELRSQRVHHACQIDAHDKVPLIIFEFMHRSNTVVFTNDSGAIGAPIESSKTFDGRFDPIIDLLTVANV